MATLDVNYGDTRDSLGSDRFLQFNLQEHFEGNSWIKNKTNFYPYRMVFH